MGCRRSRRFTVVNHDEGKTDCHDDLAKLTGCINPAIKRTLQNIAERHCEGGGSHEGADKTRSPSLYQGERHEKPPIMAEPATVLLTMRKSPSVIREAAEIRETTPCFCNARR